MATVSKPEPQGNGPDAKELIEKARAGNGIPQGPKNIVLCSDGTGNRGGKARGTNVWAIFNAVWRQPDADGKPPGKTQVTFYDDGVGTQKFIAFKLLGGAFGWGYSRNIRDLYRALVSTYEPGDSIYLFGFSRGAYTVRGLAGLILKQGILNRHEFPNSVELDRAVWAVFRDYRDQYGSIAAKVRHLLLRGFTKDYQSYRENGKIHQIDEANDHDPPLRFIGVWDTVDAVGLPFDGLSDALDWIVKFRFRDQVLHPNVKKACHAISIDDERKTFWPVMWTEPIKKDGKLQQDKRIEQAWFPGVHSNVGGGYPKDQMAQVALDWMMEKAKDEGLLFYKDVRARVREAANAHGRIYDSRAGLAAYYRYKPRDMIQICNDSKAGAEIKKPKIHVSALRRIARATADYAPANLPEEVEVVGTYNEDKRLIQAMATAYQKTARQRSRGFRKARLFVLLRRCLYYCFLAYSLGLLAAAGWFFWFARSAVEQPDVEPPLLIRYLFDGINWILPDYIFGFFRPLLEQAKVHWNIALAVMAVLIVFGILKWYFERKTRQHSLDAWRGFRDRVYPGRDTRLESADEQ